MSTLAHRQNGLQAHDASIRSVRIVPKSSYQLAARCLADAFVDDEVARYCVDTPDRDHWSDEQKEKLHNEIMEYITYAHCLEGLVTTIGESFECVALWMPPRCHPSFLGILQSGLWRMIYKLSWEGFLRLFTEFFPLLERTKREVMGSRDEDSYYLVYVGTRPDARGKGLARQLIADMTLKADREGKACYLESSNVANLSLYERLGFVVKQKIMLKRASSPVELDIMVREPQGGAKVEK